MKLRKVWGHELNLFLYLSSLLTWPLESQYAVSCRWSTWTDCLYRTVTEIWRLKDFRVMALNFWSHVMSSVAWPLDSPRIVSTAYLARLSRYDAFEDFNHLPHSDIVCWAYWLHAASLPTNSWSQHTWSHLRIGSTVQHCACLLLEATTRLSWRILIIDLPVANVVRKSRLIST